MMEGQQSSSSVLNNSKHDDRPVFPYLSRPEKRPFNKVLGVRTLSFVELGDLQLFKLLARVAKHRDFEHQILVHGQSFVVKHAPSFAGNMKLPSGKLT